jgi:hypothetical protein
LVVDGVDDVSVGAGECVAVLAQCGGGVVVAEAGLGLEDLAADEEGGDVVAEPVQSRVGNACGGSESGEAVAECAGGDRVLMVASAAEHPRSEMVFDGPFVVESRPDRRGRGSDGEAASVPGLGGRDLGSGDGPADREGVRARTFRSVLAAAGLTGSMGRVASAGDNAAMESFFALLQKNVLDRQRWCTRSELRYETIRWIEHTYNAAAASAVSASPVEFELAFRTLSNDAAHAA